MMLGGIVLAGGRSRRMGTAKAHLDWHGTPLLRHVAGRVAEATGGPVVIVAAAGQALPPLDWPVVEDPRPGLGPLQGLAAGLAALGADADVAFACATDQPHAADVLPTLLAALRPRDDAAAYRGQPLGALYRTALATIAEARLTGADASLRGLLAAVATRTLDADAPLALRSLDTPADYAAALGLRS